jgi:predicted DNA-binding transcriptional regulator AlpA
VRQEVDRAIAQARSNPPRAFSLRDVMELTSLSRSSLARLERRGELKVIRVGRRVVVAADEVERLLADGHRR